jgi:hypothetical protein
VTRVVVLLPFAQERIVEVVSLDDVVRVPFASTLRALFYPLGDVPMSAPVYPIRRYAHAGVSRVTENGARLPVYTLDGEPLPLDAFKGKEFA